MDLLAISAFLDDLGSACLSNQGEVVVVLLQSRGSGEREGQQVVC